MERLLASMVVACAIAGCGGDDTGGPGRDAGGTRDSGGGGTDSGGGGDDAGGGGEDSGGGGEDGGGGGTDAGPFDAGPRSCEGVRSDLRRERATLAACERSGQCAVVAHGTCPEGGCYEFFVTGRDLAGVRALEGEYASLDCAGGVACDCALPPDVLECVGGACQGCPEPGTACPYVCAVDCECARDACGCDLEVCVTDCADLVTTMQEMAADAAGCVEDADCTTSASPQCPELGCHIPHHRNASIAHVRTLAETYRTHGCGGGVACRCAPPPPVHCVAGRCALDM